MATKCRVLEGGLCEITWGYSKGKHNGIDLVGPRSTLAWEVAHSDGTVVEVKNDCNYNTYKQGGPKIYGNYVKIKHDDGYYTLYAHGKYNTAQVKVGQRVKRNDRLIYMGNTGYSNGAHLHWEVRNTSDVTIDPTPYLDADLPKAPEPTPTKHKIGEVVDINGVYVSSTSTEKLRPLITRGTITKIIEGARNPYLLDNGNIGWVNDDCIIDTPTTITKTVTNCYWLNLRTSPNYGNNIYTAVKAGTKLEYYETIDGWAKVRYQGKILYCGASYLK